MMRLCYIASGLHYAPFAGPSNHVISLVEALASTGRVEVALAFHGYREIPPLPVEKLDLSVVEPGTPVPRPSRRADDCAIDGIDPRPYLSYLRRCRAFVREHAGRFDAVVERMWRGGGIVGTGLKARGALCILEENGPPGLPGRSMSIPHLLRQLLHQLSQRYARRAYSRAHGIIVQTEEIKEMLQHRFSVKNTPIYVIPNGVDVQRFKPMDQNECREELGLERDALILLFAGSLDAYHDLLPCMEAMAGLPDPPVQLHVVGDGIFRTPMEQEAARLIPGRCMFHGPVPHRRVPLWINAADICIAPYGEAVLEGKRFCFSPLKILEYMACGKVVISQPHEGIARLVPHGQGGFLIPNSSRKWLEVLTSLPGKEDIAAMGKQNVQRALHHSWDAVADRYLDVLSSVAL